MYRFTIMSVILKKEESYYFTTAKGTDNNVTVSADGSSMNINLDSPIQISSSSIQSTMEVQQANIWNVSPNISASFGNNTLTYIIGGIVQPDIVLPAGQFSLSSINQAISNEFVNRGKASNLISFVGNDATQRCIAIFAQDVQANFGAANSIGNILGFPATMGVIPASAVHGEGYSIEGKSEATLNRVNSYLITSNISCAGIPINNSAANVIAQVPITSRPGSQIIYAPYHPTKINIGLLRGHSKNNLTLSLVDQDLRPTPMLGETWGVLITFRTSILLSPDRIPMLDL